MGKTNKVTSIEQLKEYSLGQIVELPSFGEGQNFFARLKRPSMLNLAKHNKIPNKLLTRATQLFMNETEEFDSQDENLMSDLIDVMEIIAKETLVEPSYDELKEAGIELTDEQLMFIFNYSQKGVLALESFRTE